MQNDGFAPESILLRGRRGRGSVEQRRTARMAARDARRQDMAKLRPQRGCGRVGISCVYGVAMLLHYYGDRGRMRGADEVVSLIVPAYRVVDRAAAASVTEGLQPAHRQLGHVQRYRHIVYV